MPNVSADTGAILLMTDEFLYKFERSLVPFLALCAARPANIMDEGAKMIGEAPVYQLSVNGMRLPENWFFRNSIWSDSIRRFDSARYSAQLGT